jgi:hypothetical protein
MSNENSSVDIQKLIAEVASRHKILMKPEDAGIALVTMNNLVLDHALERAHAGIRATLSEFQTNMQKAEKRGGSVLGQEVKEAAEKMREGLKSDLQVAGLKATELVHMVHEAHRRPTLARCCALGLMAALLLFGCGLWLGLVLH